MSILKKYHNTWLSEYLIDISSNFFDSNVILESKDLLDKGLVHEVYIEPGRISSRVTVDKRMSQRVVLTLAELNPDDFDEIVRTAAESQLVLVGLYNNQLPDVFFANEQLKSLLLFKIEDISAAIEDQKVSLQDARVAAVFEKFIEQILSTPLNFITLRGYGAEQFQHDVRELRARSLLKLKDKNKHISISSEVSQICDSADLFYNGAEEPELDITVRADELPASLLRRLDHLPTNGGLEYIDKNLENAYERITRLAQSLARFI